MSARPRQPVLPNVVLACVLLVMVYVLSYAPVVHWTERADQIVCRRCVWLHAVPFVRNPLYRWAYLWGPATHFQIAMEATGWRWNSRARP